MSTRCTVLHGDNFHLFTDYDDGDYRSPYPPLVHLTLSGPDLDCEMSNGRVSVAIPVAVWEAIRRCGVVNLADVTPDETNRRLIASIRADDLIGRVASGGLFAEFHLGTHLPEWKRGEPVNRELLVERIAAAYDRDYAARRELARQVNALLGRDPEDELE